MSRASGRPNEGRNEARRLSGRPEEGPLRSLEKLEKMKRKEQLRRISEIVARILRDQRT